MKNIPTYAKDIVFIIYFIAFVWIGMTVYFWVLGGICDAESASTLSEMFNAQLEFIRTKIR